MTAAIGPHNYTRLLNSWTAHHQVKMANANIFKAAGTLSARCSDIWMHEWSKHGTCACQLIIRHSDAPTKTTACSSTDQSRFFGAVLNLFDHLLGSTDVISDCCDDDALDCTFHVGIDPVTLDWAALPGGAIYTCI